MNVTPNISASDSHGALIDWLWNHPDVALSGWLVAFVVSIPSLARFLSSLQTAKQTKLIYRLIGIAALIVAGTVIYVAAFSMQSVELIQQPKRLEKTLVSPSPSSPATTLVPPAFSSTPKLTRKQLPSPPGESPATRLSQRAISMEQRIQFSAFVRSKPKIPVVLMVQTPVNARSSEAARYANQLAQMLQEAGYNISTFNTGPHPDETHAGLYFVLRSDHMHSAYRALQAAFDTAHIPIITNTMDGDMYEDSIHIFVYPN